jgi:hypothetical protein
MMCLIEFNQVHKLGNSTLLQVGDTLRIVFRNTLSFGEPFYSSLLFTPHKPIEIHAAWAHGLNSTMGDGMLPNVCRRQPVSGR